MKEPKQSYSQFGEDVELLKVFGRTSGYFVEVGANDGRRDSNTALLEEHGWNGLLIEANPALAEKARLQRSAPVINCAVASAKASTLTFYTVEGGAESLNGLSTLLATPDFCRMVEAYGGVVVPVEVPCSQLTEILGEHGCPPAFDLLSVDIEGAEEGALRALDFGNYRPRVILCEDNSRGERQEIPKLLRTRGYWRAHRTGVNDWYVRAADLGPFAGRFLILRLRLWKWALERRVAAARRWLRRGRR